MFKFKRLEITEETFDRDIHDNPSFFKKLTIIIMSILSVLYLLKLGVYFFADSGGGFTGKRLLVDLIYFPVYFIVLKGAQKLALKTSVDMKKKWLEKQQRLSI